MINAMISIPVHEKTEVVIDQIINYKYFCPNCGIVLHISKGFDYKNSFHTEKEFLFILSTFDNVFVNPSHLDTAFADIIHTHVSNFDYVSKIVDFEYFCMGASNDLFVRAMPEIKDYDINCDDKLVENKANWAWFKHTFSDEYLKSIVDYFNGTKSDVRNSQIEGSFYKKDIFKNISEIIKKFYNFEDVKKNNRIIYPREEVYFSTIAFLLNKDVRNLKLNYTFVAWNNFNFTPKIEEIISISNGNIEGKFSVKRVARNLNDTMRFMIATQIGHYREQSIDKIKIKCLKMYRKFFNLVSNRRRIFIGHAEAEGNIRKRFQIKNIETFLPLKLNNNQIFLDEIFDSMENNREALFVVVTLIYPIVSNFLSQRGFRENIDFIDGSLLID